MKKIVTIFLVLVILVACALFLVPYIKEQGKKNEVPITSGDAPVSDEKIAPLVFDPIEKDTIVLEGLEEEVSTQWVHSDLGYKVKMYPSILQVVRLDGRDVYSLFNTPYSVNIAIEKNDTALEEDSVSFDTAYYSGDGVDIRARIIVDPDLSKDVIIELQEGYLARIYQMLNTIEIEK